jgi:hypothetical protein
MTQRDHAHAVDPVPPEAYPSFQPMTGQAPQMPIAWACTALLHPFSPPLSINPQPDTPFFQLCIAHIVCSRGNFLSAQIVGCIFGTWWYIITPSGTRLSTDEGATWTDVDMGWSVPQDWFGAQGPNAACAGSSPLNWMATNSVDWWKIPVPLPNLPSAATWMWFDSASQNPVRMMFGYGPPSPTKGDPTQLALLQMFSFTYFPSFEALPNVAIPATWTNPTIEGFSVGNPNGYGKFVWNSNFGMTAFMTPVNENFNPLPTRVLYVWKPDQDYKIASDRAQNTLMQFSYNSGDVKWQEALLFGRAPAGMQPPPGSDVAFLITKLHSPAESCENLPFPQEPPDWVSIPAVQGTIQATITNNPLLCPNATVTIFSVLFPPAPPNYPNATYLWTWYAPTPGSKGKHSRPITFMQSQSGVNVGTSLALADYYYYQEFATPIDPSNFTVPGPCAEHSKKRIG